MREVVEGKQYCLTANEFLLHRKDFLAEKIYIWISCYMRSRISFARYFTLTVRIPHLNDFFIPCNSPVFDFWTKWLMLGSVRQCSCHGLTFFSKTSLSSSLLQVGLWWQLACVDACHIDLKTWCLSPLCAARLLYSLLSSQIDKNWGF